jgi:hypothetical protein
VTNIDSDTAGFRHPDLGLTTTSRRARAFYGGLERSRRPT